ncbi:MAG: hypothetical protein GYB31_12785 [Bacteroidetes bacterium]|nr:hypothetical protein [Bacteroidota bacterium]
MATGEYTNMNKLSNNIFLADSIGALLTASLLNFLIAPYETFFGMPQGMVYILAAIALLFGLYSLICHLRKASFKPWLQIIAILNLIYVLFTGSLLFMHAKTLSTYGYLYFGIEILIILYLVSYEWKLAKNA